MSLERDLYEAAVAQRCIDTHCHLIAGKRPYTTLAELLSTSYLDWQFKDMIGPSMDMERFLDTVSCNSYFYALARGLGELYSPDGAPLGPDNWREIQRGLAAAAEDPRKLDRILRERCNYQAVVLDMQKTPGGDNGMPELFRPAFRCDMFLKGHPSAGADENGNDPRDYLDMAERPSFEEYLDAVERAVIHQADSGAVALKLAIAYERGLDFVLPDQEKARRGWERREAGADEVKAFEDAVMFHLCRVAGEHEIPVQIHTGMGKLERSNALWLKPLLDHCTDTQFVLLHCSYPHTADAVALLHEYNNVAADLSWLPLLSPGVAGRVLDEVLDIADARRIGWGCDAEDPEESLGAHRMFCQVLAQTLSRKAEMGYYSVSTCRRLIEQILYEGPASLYKVER